jgi:hypothetical protein
LEAVNRSPRTGKRREEKRRKKGKKEKDGKETL